jgi:hypothetical protein
MSLLKSRVVFVAALLTAAALFSPSACQAGLFDCFCKSSSQPAPTTYAPPFQAQRVAYSNPCDPCNPCAAPQVSYVPEVKYRWKYSRIERTEYQPVAACDPCTGSPTTSYRPVTKKSLLPWLHREAYTTYKAVPMGGVTPVSYMMPTSYNPCATACDPCSTACDPCGVGGSMAAPSLSSSGCVGCAGGSTVYTDSSPSDPGYSSGTTFQNGGATPWKAKDSTQEVLKAQPDEEPQVLEEEGSSAATGMPKLIIPTGRTASKNRVRTVSYNEPASLSMNGNLYQAATAVMPLRLVPVE